MRQHKYPMSRATKWSATCLLPANGTSELQYVVPHEVHKLYTAQLENVRRIVFWSMFACYLSYDKNTNRAWSCGQNLIQRQPPKKEFGVWKAKSQQMVSPWKEIMGLVAGWKCVINKTTMCCFSLFPSCAQCPSILSWNTSLCEAYYALERGWK